jgi:hypothetical protein
MAIYGGVTVHLLRAVPSAAIIIVGGYEIVLKACDPLS